MKLRKTTDILICYVRRCDMKCDVVTLMNDMGLWFEGKCSELLRHLFYLVEYIRSCDSTLRQTIRGFALKESRSLIVLRSGPNGTGDIKECCCTYRTRSIQMIEGTGIETSLTEEDMKEYLT